MKERIGRRGFIRLGAVVAGLALGNAAVSEPVQKGATNIINRGINILRSEINFLEFLYKKEKKERDRIGELLEENFGDYDQEFWSKFKSQRQVFWRPLKSSENSNNVKVEVVRSQRRERPVMIIQSKKFRDGDIEINDRIEFYFNNEGKFQQKPQEGIAYEREVLEALAPRIFRNLQQEWEIIELQDASGNIFEGGIMQTINEDRIVKEYELYNSGVGVLYVTRYR